MTVTKKWDGTGLSSGALSTASVGAGDNAFDSVGGTTQTIVAGSPTKIRQVQDASVTAYVQWLEASRAAWGFSAFVTTPPAWPSASFSLLSLFTSGGAVAVRWDLGGSTSPGQIRIRNTSAQLAASANGVIANSTRYFVRAKAAISAAGTADIEFWTPDGATLVGSLSATGNFGTDAAYSRFGNTLTTVAVGQTDWSNLKVADANAFLPLPSGGTPAATGWQLGSIAMG